MVIFILFLTTQLTFLANVPVGFTLRENDNRLISMGKSKTWNQRQIWKMLFPVNKAARPMCAELYMFPTISEPAEKHTQNNDTREPLPRTLNLRSDPESQKMQFICEERILYHGHCGKAFQTNSELQARVFKVPE